MKHIEELKKLKLPKDQFAIFGSGPLAVRGLRDNEDLDILVKHKLWEQLVKSHPPATLDMKSLTIGKIEIYHDWPGFKEPEKLVDNADVIDQFRFVKMNAVLKWKKSFNRPKDKDDIKLIEKFLKK